MSDTGRLSNNRNDKGMVDKLRFVRDGEVLSGPATLGQAAINA